MDIALRLRERRRAAGMTQAALAAAAGTHEISICLYETGKRRPKPESIAKLAAALGCEPADLTDASVAVPDMTEGATGQAPEDRRVSDQPVEVDRRIA